MILLALLVLLLTAAVLVVRHARKPPVRIVCAPKRGRIVVSVERRAFHNWPAHLAYDSYRGGLPPSLTIGRADLGDDESLARLIADAHEKIDTATGESTQAAEMIRLSKVLAGKRA